VQLPLSLDPAVKQSEHENGLTGAEARRLLDEVGFNEPGRARRRNVVTQLLLLFANPLVVILLITSIVSAALGEPVSAGIIVTIVLVSVVINFAQSYRSERAVERLREGVAVTATALRDGAWIEVPRREVVPGDCSIEGRGLGSRRCAALGSTRLARPASRADR
jgi:P-type Mg2+ transporter